MKKLFLSAASAAAAIFTTVSANELADAVAADYEYVLDLYKHFHENPELSFRESESAARMTAELEGLGFTVTNGVGDKWTRNKAKADAGEVLEGVGGYGLVAVMENGDGPTLMLRADMDALPLEEKTGLPYASKVVSTDYKGQEAPVMHACAHDSHMAILIGAARQLVAMKDQWSGTLVLIGQPAEEIGHGAVAMLEDGLYKKFPKPDYILATHTSGWDSAGDVTYTPGWALANVDSVDIYIKGIGAHGSAPHMGKDPIVLGSQIINALQTLVSRETDPLEAGVVTVGSFQAGYKHNIIPDAAHLQITVRSYEDKVRAQLLEGIERIAIAQAKSAGLPDDLMPEVKIEQDYTPSTFNDEALTERVMAAVSDSVGADRVYIRPPSMGGEDFSQFGRTAEDIPTVIFWTGGNDPEAMKAAREGTAPPPPANHSPFFAPIPEPTLKTGVQAMTAGALELLGPAGE
ncbi:amidohydrolase [Hyphococcus flavus]|uniref:Amidohydrolase n=1 Tax=Hyphococcus flavus TaxID=1866326 RepID=A0AAE9ZE89_9PROT|nr:amidohydrolase [Hyphococcus flavus]WDI30947.1 amidohydrolase [Hyphococcus flavus]